MIILLSSLILILSINEIVHSQSYAEILTPDNRIEKQAKLNTKNLLVSLSDSLRLSKKEMRIRRFELTACQEIYDFLKGGDLFASVEPFLNSNSCSGIYAFQYKTNEENSYRLFSFYYDLEGRLIDCHQQWMMVIH